MDLLLFVLGVFGLIPIITMTLLYGAVPIVMIGLFVVGLVARPEDLPQTEGRAAPTHEALRRAA